jgi:hypothetical protein
MSVERIASQSFDGSTSQADPEYDHPKQEISPASGAESLFLAGLATSAISASVLAEQIRSNHRAWSPGGTLISTSALSVATDDFASAVECHDDLLLDDQEYSFFGKDVLGTRSRSIPEIETEDSFDDDLSEVEIMQKASSNYGPPPTTLPPKPKMAPAGSKAKTEIDAAEKLYEGAKGVWAWGKGVAVVSPFLGLAEGIANKVVGVAGTDLEEIDGNLKPQLAQLDLVVLNPAIDAIVGMVLKTLSKSGEVLKPVIEAFFIPFGLIKTQAETPELTLN